jgi:hypothetical protein
LFTGTWFWRDLRNSCFQPLLQDFFAGIPAGQEFLYFHQITPVSFGIPPDSCRIPVPAKTVWLWPADKFYPN